MLRWLALAVHLAAFAATVFFASRAVSARREMLLYEGELKTMQSIREYAKLGAPGNYQMPTIYEQTSATERMVEASNTMKANGWSAASTFVVGAIALGVFVKRRPATR